MEPLEIASKLASHHHSCKGDRCPFASQCDGRTRGECGMYRLAMMIRSQEYKINSLEIMVKGLRDMLLMLQNYANDLEVLNRRYKSLVDHYRNIDKPKIYGLNKPKHRAKPKENLVEMDGDPRYAMPEEPKEPKPETVVV